MDPAIGWFQPEQCGPALSLWTEIWNSHQRFDSTELSSKHDSKNSERLVVSGNGTFSSDDRKPPIKKSDTNCSAESSFNNRVKLKDIKASTYGLIRTEDLIKDGLTPWRSRNFYNPGLLGCQSLQESDALNASLEDDIKRLSNKMEALTTQNKILAVLLCLEIRVLDQYCSLQCWFEKKFKISILLQTALSYVSNGDQVMFIRPHQFKAVPLPVEGMICRSTALLDCIKMVLQIGRRRMLLYLKHNQLELMRQKLQIGRRRMLLYLKHNQLELMRQKLVSTKKIDDNRRNFGDDRRSDFDGERSFRDDRRKKDARMNINENHRKRDFRNILIEKALEYENVSQALILVKQALRLYNSDIIDDIISRKLFVLRQNTWFSRPFWYTSITISTASRICPYSYFICFKAGV